MAWCFKKNNFFYLLGILLTILPMSVEAARRTGADEPQIVVHNRILAKVNGRVITVVDLLKKLDLVFYRQFPQYKDVLEARFQFYQLHWKRVLDELVDGELILSSSKDLKIEVTEGDVRQEIEETLGPDVVGTIAQIGASYEEIAAMVEREIIIQRMTQMMAYAPALASVGPKEIRESYEEYAKTHPIEETWSYRVISIKATSPLDALWICNETTEALKKGLTAEEIESAYQGQDALPKGATVQVSELFQRDAKELSKAHKTVLLTLQEGSFSEPVPQQTKGSTKVMAYRIFILEKHTPRSVVPLREVESAIRNELLEKAVAEEMAAYISKLRMRAKLDETYFKKMIPQGFEPFQLVIPS